MGSVKAGVGASYLAAAILASPLAAQDTASVRLPDVEVRAARDASPLRLVPAGATVLDAGVLRTGRPAAALEEALRLVPGVYAVNPGNPGIDERISVRGFGARSAFGVRGVQVILDGVPQTLPDGQGQLTDIDLAEAERIEVIRGGTSVLYGNAGGGVVAVETGRSVGRSDGRTVGLSGRGLVEGGGNGFTKIVADAGVPVGAGELSAGGGWARGDGWREHSEHETRRARLGWAAPLGGGTDLGMSLRWTDQPRLENPGALTEAELAADPSQSAPANLAADSRKAIEQWAASAVVTRRLGGAADGRVRVAVFGALRDVENPLAFGTILLDRTSGGMRSEVSLPLGGRMTPLLTAGFDAQWARDDRRNLTPDGAVVTLDQLDRTREVGPFALARLAPAPGWVVSAGLRYDNVHFDVEDRLLADGDDSGDRTMARLAPSLGVVWARGDGFEPYAGVRSSFETPTTTELANQPDGSGGLNPDLGPQTAVHWEAGARGRAARVDWSAALFRAEVDDLLVPFEDPAVPGRRFFRNAGRSRHQGAELGVAWRPAPPLALRAAYTLADYAYVDYEVDGVRYDGNTVPGIPRHFLVASAEWRFRNGIGAAVEQAVTSSVQADDANSAEADGWAATDLRLWWEGLRGTGLQPFVAVRNLFDRSYAGSVVVNAAGGRYYEPAARRWLAAGVALR